MSAAKRRSGRPKAAPVPLPPKNTDGGPAFVCSACQAGFELYSKAHRHTLTGHYGLARLNQPLAEPFSNAEKVRAYGSALKVLSYLECAGCEKRFRSGLGLQIHETICGKSDAELSVDCELCGKLLKKSSIRTHLQLHLEKREPPPVDGGGGGGGAAPGSKLINLDKPVLVEESAEGGRPVRQSARKAMAMFARIEADEEEEEERALNGWPGRKRRRSDCWSGTDFQLTFSGDSSSAEEEEEEEEEGDEEDDEEAESGEEQDGGSDGVQPAVYEYDRERAQLAALGEADEAAVGEMFEQWAAYFELLYEGARQWPDDDQEQFAACNYHGYFKCPLMCKSLFDNMDALRAHYEHCQLRVDYKCTFCELRLLDKLPLLRHLFDVHHSQLPRIVKQVAKVKVARVAKLPASSAGSVAAALARARRNAEFVVPTTDFDQFASSHYVQAVFPEWMPSPGDFHQLEPFEQAAYLPTRTESPAFRSRFLSSQTESTQSPEWSRLRLFEHAIQANHVTIFTGGPVYAGAWAPLPSGAKLTSNTANGCKAAQTKPNVLCVATVASPDQQYRANSSEKEPGLLQFWSFDRLDYRAERAATEPKLSFTIAHEYGVIWDMCWCPGGTGYLEQMTEDVEVEAAGVHSGASWARLGLLALACADGQVRILSVPMPEQLRQSFPNRPSEELLMLQCRPVATLVAPGRCASVYDGDAICKTISWSRTDGQQLVAAGYGNGLIALFNLANESPLLRTVDARGTLLLRWQRCWIGHGSIVNSVKLLPYSGSAHLISGGFDRCMKLWDLNDLSMPVNLQRRGVITRLDWSCHWCGVFSAYDDCYMNLRNHVQYRGLTPDALCNSLSKHKGCVWDLSLSDWLSVEASVDFAGEVVMNLGFRPNNRRRKKTKRQTDFKFLSLYHIEFDRLSDTGTNQAEPAQTDRLRGEPAQSDSPQTLTTSQENGEPAAANGKDPPAEKLKNLYLVQRDEPRMDTYEAFAGDYGLTFHDPDLNENSRIPAEEIGRVRYSENMNYARLGDFPLPSLTKVEWNPNQESASWLFTSGQSGLTRISCVPMLLGRRRVRKHSSDGSFDDP